MSSLISTKVQYPCTLLQDKLFKYDNRNYKVKGKASPLQALTGPEGSKRLRAPDFKTNGT
jgi:hypothetical protein